MFPGLRTGPQMIVPDRFPNEACKAKQEKGAAETRRRGEGGTSMADLIAIGYPDETTAARAAKEVERLAEDHAREAR